MKTIDNFFNTSHGHPFYGDRQSKIQELRKPVYSKKIKQKKHKRVLGSTQFFPIQEIKNNLKANNRSNSNDTHKVKRSKSDLFLNRKKDIFQTQDCKTAELANNLIIQKLEYDKDANQAETKRNSFMKSLSQIVLIRNTTPNKNKSKETGQKSFVRSSNCFFQKSIHQQDTILLKKQSTLYTPEKNSDRKQIFRVVELMKKEEIDDNMINQLSLLRKKRNSLGQQNKNIDSQKKESLIRKNSLFLMNYLKQKEKQLGSDKSPHINHMKNAAQNIKIVQNSDIKKNILHKISQKIIFKNKVEQQHADKLNKIFNTMKIQPW